MSEPEENSTVAPKKPVNPGIVIALVAVCGYVTWDTVRDITSGHIRYSSARTIIEILFAVAIGVVWGGSWLMTKLKREKQ